MGSGKKKVEKRASQKRARNFKVEEYFLYAGIGHQVARVEYGGGRPTKIITMQGTMFTFPDDMLLTRVEFKKGEWIEKGNSDS